MTISEYLNRVAARLERGWTQGAYARDANGGKIDDASPDAVCWCLDGAIWAEREHTPFEVGRAGRIAVIETLRPNTLIHFNDTPGRTQAEVVAVVRRAAERAGEQS